LNMNGKVLLVLGISSADENGIAIENTGGRRDVIIKDRGEKVEEIAIDKAFRYAETASKPVVVLQIINSDLYHYGHNDIILTAAAKTRFLFYVRDQVLKRGKDRERMLEERAKKQGISLEVYSVESEDPASSAIEEAKNGYDVIFLPKESKRLFPIFNKTVEQHLRKEIPGAVVVC